MADDPLERVLRLVAEGRLTAREAGPLLDALDRATSDHQPASDRPTGQRPTASASSEGGAARAIRVEVSDDGRAVVNLRVPLALGRAVLDRIPGLSEAVTAQVREALASGIRGPIVEVDDDGDGVRIIIE